MGAIQLNLKENDTDKYQDHQKQKQLLTIINIYAPTTTKVREDPNALTEMYAQIESIIAEVRNKNSSLLLLGGDFNAKIGKSPIKEPCVGRFFRGKRNASRQNLIDFCTTHQLFVCNSSFKHPARHITTWQNTRTVNGSYMMIYNQIDYIICSTSKKHCLIDARSFSNTLTDSDHRLVICEMEVDLHRLYKQKVSHKNKIYNCSMLVNDKEKKEEYQKAVETKINQLDNKEIEWKVVQSKICEAAESTIGYNRPQNNNNNRLEDREVEKLSIRQKELKLKINNCKDMEKVRTMKAKRNKILHQIQKKLRKLKENCLDEKIKEIDETKDSAKCLKQLICYQGKNSKIRIYMIIMEDILSIHNTFIKLSRTTLSKSVQR